MLIRCRFAERPLRRSRRRVDRAAGLLSITHLLKKTPDQLSGGEKQRTALARGLLKNAQRLRSRRSSGRPRLQAARTADGRTQEPSRGTQGDLPLCYGRLPRGADHGPGLVVLDAGRVAAAGEAISLYNSPINVRSLELIGFPKANVLDGHDLRRHVDRRAASAARNGAGRPRKRRQDRLPARGDPAWFGTWRGRRGTSDAGRESRRRTRRPPRSSGAPLVMAFRSQARFRA